MAQKSSSLTQSHSIMWTAKMIWRPFRRLTALGLTGSLVGWVQCDTDGTSLPVCRSFEQLRARYMPMMRQAAEDGDKDATEVLDGFQETADAIKQNTARRTIVKTSGVVTLVGTCHVSEQSSRDVIAACNSLRPTCVVLELCEERLMPCLVCPPEATPSTINLKTNTSW